MVTTIINFLDAIYPLSEALKEALRACIICEKFPKRHLFLRPGQICEHVYFIKKGLVRSFQKKGKKGREFTVWFMKENNAVISVVSFYKQEPGIEYIEALEDVELGYINYNTLTKLRADFPEFNAIYYILTEHYYVLTTEHNSYKLTQTARERYELFLEHHSDLSTRVPLKYIASYLGLANEALCRVKAQVNRLKRAS